MQIHKEGKILKNSPRDIDVVILCGGQGRRIRQVINDRPKAMAEINRRPFLDILLDYASSYGLSRFILCTGYMGDTIENHYKKKDLLVGRKILFSKEENPLGTAGAIKNAEGFIRSNPFLVINGDSFCAVNLAEFFSFHSKVHALLSVVILKGKSASEYGMVGLDNQSRITHFNEKSSGAEAFISAGVYLFEKDALSLIPSDKKYSLEYDFFPSLAGKNCYGYITKEKFIDIGTPERYEQAKKILSQERRVRY